MRKKFLLTIATGAIALVMAPAMAFADVTEVSDEATLAGIFTNGGDAKLMTNIAIEKTLVVSGTATVNLDLNGNDITAKNDTLTANETDGSKDALIVVRSGGELTVDDTSDEGTGKISTGNKPAIYAGIKMTEKNGYDANKTAKLTVNGGTIEGYYYAITGNGTRHNTDITINGGTIKGLNAADNLGIYHPQNGSLTITDGTITGLTGIEMRAGILNVSGGTITGTGTSTAVVASDSASTTKGAGIAVAQHNSGLETEVNITGGTVKGNTALNQANPQGNLEVADNEVSLNISGGNFEATGENGAAVASENNKTGFVSGGTFNKPIENDLVDSGASAATLTSGGSSTFLVGNEAIQEAAAAAEPGAEIKITKDNETLELSDITPGVKVTLGAGVEGVEVNGVEVKAGARGYVVPTAAAPASTTPTASTSASTPADSSVQTGDASNIMIPIIIALAALMAMTGVIVTRRRNG